MHIQSKRGRPPGNRPKHDYGTPELISKRMTLSPADATQSTNPLDVLLSRGIITPEAHKAAACFAAQRKIVFGKATTQAVDLLNVSGGQPNEVNLPDAEGRYRRACQTVLRHGEKTFKAMESLVVHEQWPHWIQIPRSVHWERRLVLLGIAALHGWYREEFG